MHLSIFTSSYNSFLFLIAGIALLSFFFLLTHSRAPSRKRSWVRLEVELRDIERHIMDITAETDQHASLIRTISERGATDQGTPQEQSRRSARWEDVEHNRSLLRLLEDKKRNIKYQLENLVEKQTT